MRQETATPNAGSWVRAALFTGALWLGLDALSFSPAVATPLFALATGVAAFRSGPSAVVLAIALLALPVLAADLVTGLVFLIAGVALFNLLAARSGSGFLLVTYGVLFAGAGPAWAVVPLAGALFGATGGAATAALACVALQVTGGFAGQAHAGPVATGLSAAGTPALGQPAADVLGLGWVQPSIAAVDPGVFLGALPATEAFPLLVLQACTWAAGAALSAALLRPHSSPYRTMSALLAAAAGVAAVATAHLAVLGAFEALPDHGAGAMFASSLAAALIVTAARESLLPSRATARSVAPASRAHDDADVDDLLRRIATAEEELAARHSADATVLITDIQAFSALTEREGSLVSAKVIQRTRDLLMPAIANAGGCGKSTGGDGLVAAFPDPRSAVNAAVEMQRALARHNETETAERAIRIRAGIASGEVVLDRSGRPFIGSAVNLAARIMQLAEGGQILVSREIADAAHSAGIAVAPRGSFELKNIGSPIEVAEVPWETAPPRSARDVVRRAVSGGLKTKAPA